jgi:Holliday junction resolvase RusA-like endonuclease
VLIFTLDIIPEPQKQTRFSFRGSKPHAYDPSTVYKTHLQWQMKHYAPAVPFPGPVEVGYTFYLPIPKSTSKIQQRQMLSGKIFHIKKPDVDNLAYVVTNAMKGIIYEDDSQIVRQFSEKYYGARPQIVVKVMSLDEDNPIKEKGE